jgi:hypothetical protein
LLVIGPAELIPPEDSVATSMVSPHKQRIDSMRRNLISQGIYLRSIVEAIYIAKKYPRLVDT